jgi:PAS domain S-box-containing protein
VRIRSKVLLAAFLMIMATGLSVILVVRSISKGILEEQMISHLASIAEIRARYVNSILNEYKEIALLTSTGNVFIDLVSETEDTEEAIEALNRRISSMLSSYGAISRFRVLDRNGTVIASSHPDIGDDLSTDSLFLNITDGGVYSGELHYSLFTGNPVLSISAPIYKSGEFRGAVVVNFDADWELFSSVMDRTGLGETGEVYVIDRNGLMLTPSIYIEDAVLHVNVDLETAGGIAETFEFGSDEHEPVAVSTRNYMGKDVISIHSYIPDINCILIAEISVDEAFAPVEKLTRSMLMVITSVLALGLVLSIVVSSNLAKPVEKLKNGVEEIMKGNLEYQIKTGAKDETGELSRAFGDMTSKLRKSRNSLKEYTADLERTISDRTAELRKRYERSELQRIATLNILQDLDESSGKLKDEISERKRTEKALEAEKERLAVTLRSIGDAVIATDTTGKIIMINRVAEELTGWLQNEAAGKILADVLRIIDENTRESCRDPVDEVLESMDVISYSNHTILVDKSESEKPIAYSCAPIKDRESKLVGAVVVFRDVTEHLKTEEELRKTARLESIGILAGGLAHDFNNMLSAILGNISLAKMSLEPEDSVYKTLTKSENASMRARDLTQQLLTFSKGGAPVRETTSIADLISETADFALGGSKSRGEISIPENLRVVDIDRGQISEVLSNLIINADQAMPEGGVIRITAENAVINMDEIPSLPEGSYIVVTISDQGIGIPAKQLEKIFDPYFTTKQKGSGLGLSIAYSILRKHDGFITVDSEIGVGTEFHLYLPASDGDVSAGTELEQEAISGEGKILVMDDDKMVCDVAGGILRHLGYKVDFAENGEEALNKYRKAMEIGKPFDVVIMDLTIPGGMGGRSAIALLLEMDPGAKAIVSSGYSEDPVMGNYEKFGFYGCIKKPYRVAELGRILLEVIKK